MAFNQISNQDQAMNSPPLPLITNSQMMNSHVISDHVYANPEPNNQAPPLAIPSHFSSTNDLLSMEYLQYSSGLNQQREVLGSYLHMQHVQTLNSIMIGQANQDNLVQNYVSKLLGVIQEKEMELVTANQANFELRERVGDFESQLMALRQTALEKEATVANLNQQLEMIQKSHQIMMTTNESDSASSCVPDAASFCGDLKKDMLDMNCQMCYKELSTVLIFPCKHLCCCAPCEAYVYSCPVCETVKESSVEVSWPVMNKQGADKEE